jgi:hypothetical protein
MTAAPRSPIPSRGSQLTPAFERATVADAMHVGIVTFGVLSTLDVVGIVAWGRA